jgi:hypothetical protein
VSHTNSLNVDCNYKDHDYLEFKNTYICYVHKNFKLTSKESTRITSASGSHKSGHNNDNVLSFHAVDLTINYFPIGLESIFKNLKVIVIERTYLKEVHQSDLKPFPQLEFLCLAGNDIKTLEEDLFEFNPNLNLVMFYTCKITHIDPNVFDHLDKMTYLLLESNPCITIEARNDRSKVLEIVKKIQNRQCINPSIKKKEKTVDITTLSVQVSQPENCAAVKSKFVDFVTSVKSLVASASNESEASMTTGQCQAFSETKMDSDLSNINSMMSITNKKVLTDLSDIAASANDNYANFNEKIDNLGVKLDNLEGNFNSLLSKIMEISSKYEKIDEIEEKLQKILKAVQQS